MRTACSRGAKKIDHERHATIIREAVQPLTGSAQDYDSLLALIGDPILVGDIIGHDAIRRGSGYVLLDSSRFSALRKVVFTPPFQRPSSEVKRSTPTKNKRAKPIHIANDKCSQKWGHPRTIAKGPAAIIAKPVDNMKIIVRKTRRSRSCGSSPFCILAAGRPCHHRSSG